MPALQVRDMPEQLYRDVKTLAEREHRSIAQQTIIALEGMVRASRGESSSAPDVQPALPGTARPSTPPATADKERRKAVLSAIHASGISLSGNALDPVSVVREGRQERENAFPSLEALQNEGTL